MPQLTDLPDELLLDILARTFPPPTHSHSPPSNETNTQPPPPPPPTLQNHIITKRLYALSHQAFFETHIHHIRIHPDPHPAWDEGTLLHDIYSPTFSKESPRRDVWAFVTNVQNLRLAVCIDDEEQTDRALHEVGREVRRYPRCRTVEVWFCLRGRGSAGVGREELRERVVEVMGVEVRRRKGVRCVVKLGCGK